MRMFDVDNPFDWDESVKKPTMKKVRVQKSAEYHMRFTEEEMDMLRAEAKDRGLPISMIIRDALDAYFEQTDYDKKYIWMQ